MKNHYSAPQILLHWLTLLMVILTYSAMLLKDTVPDEYYAQIKELHFNFGSIVWLLMLGRLSLYFFYPAPPIAPPLPVWQQRAAQAMHGLLYLMFLSLPVLGFLTLAYEGKSWQWLGWSVPASVTPDTNIASWLKAVHETIANLGYFMIGLHALAALYHHYLRLDNTLQRMLPSRRKR